MAYYAKYYVDEDEKTALVVTGNYPLCLPVEINLTDWRGVGY